MDSVVSLTIPHVAVRVTRASNDQEVPVFSCVGVRFHAVVFTRLCFDSTMFAPGFCGTSQAPLTIRLS